MPNTSIALSDHWVEFTKRMVASGRYGSVSEVVREGLRLIEARERHRAAIIVALEAGETGDRVADFDDVLEEVRQEGK